MVIFFYGTTGESIKLLPLLKEFPRDQYVTISTQQQIDQLNRFYAETKTDPAEYKIGRKKDAVSDLEKISEVPGWLARSFIQFPSLKKSVIKEIKSRKESRKSTVMIVHGDTMTTVIGALFAKFCGLKVAHVEAGLRSHNWRHPFPEEIDRMITSKIARIHFAPGNEPVANLKSAKVKGEIVDIKNNTVLDSVLLAKEANFKSPVSHIADGYCLVSIHRNELLALPDTLRELLVILKEHSADHDVVFVEHPVTLAKIREIGCEELLDSERITRVPKLSYMQFISVAAKAGYIVTDSGGLQEEASYFGIPCLIHRKATERTEGLGKVAVLSMYDAKVLKDFLENPGIYKAQGILGEIKADHTKSPTNIIKSYLEDHGYLKR